MIAYQKAFELVMAESLGFGKERLPLVQSTGRILAETIVADRDFPPFDRVTKDGIAIRFDQLDKGLHRFKIEGIAAAGSPQKSLEDARGCIEVMTGAMLPKGTDTVIMYEHLHLNDGVAKIEKAAKKGQNIHDKGSDQVKGSVVLEKGIRISPAEIGVLASVGKTHIQVKKLPKVAIVSTGNELVDIGETPQPHQIRKSNSHTLESLLQQEGIDCQQFHLKDDFEVLKRELATLLDRFEVILLSGGVSKGKYDFLPKVFESLGVQRIFHRVRQRPGKPFWFGKHLDSTSLVFAFPGNPASTFANYHLYFIPWLYQGLGLQNPECQVALLDGFQNETDLTRCIRASVTLEGPLLRANLIMGNGSGDLTSLTKANGLVRLQPNTEYRSGDIVPFIPTRKMI